MGLELANRDLVVEINSNMPVVLEMETGPQVGRKSVLRSGQAVVVGRGDEADLPLPSDPLLSRRHFQVAAEGAGAVVRDLGSTNGTLLNGQRIDEAELHDGDRIRAGATTFVVRITVPGVARPTTLPDEPPATTEPADETAPQSAEADAPKSGAEVTAARVRAAAQSGKRTLPEVPPVWVRYPDQELLAELSDGPLLREDPRYLQSVVLEIATKGPLRRRWRLRPGQTATVGRGADAEFIVASDPAMSSVHFAITAEVDCCRIQDRQSRRGTLVNGQPIKSAVLHHRDRIQAGQTEFVVAIRGGRRAPPDMRDRRGADFVLDARPDPALRPTCTAEVCPSGLTVFRGVAPTEQPARVTRLLARAAPLYVLVDFGKAAVPLPADLHERTPLLPASPTSKEDVASPLFVADAEVRDLDAVIAAAWGKDAVVSLLSQQPRPALLDRLQELAHAALPTGERASNGACLGIAWPSLLELLLRHTPADQVGKLLPGVDAYVLEGKSLCPWQIFAREEFSAILAKLGFQPPPNPQPSPGVAVGTDSA